MYGITRRGFGASNAPAPDKDNYSADRLGDDILAVIDALKLNRPVLVGHSIAGEELSSIGSRHPERVAGLIYLDAAYGYAYYDNSQGFFPIDLRELKAKLAQLGPLNVPEKRELVTEPVARRSAPEWSETSISYKRASSWCQRPCHRRPQSQTTSRALRRSERTRCASKG